MSSGDKIPLTLEDLRIDFAEHLRITPRKVERPARHLFQRQRELEERALARGYEQYVAGEESAKEAGHSGSSESAPTYMRSLMDRLSDALHDECTRPRQGRPQEFPAWVDKIGDYQTVAFFILQNIIDGIIGRGGAPTQFKYIAVNLTDTMIGALRLRKWKRQGAGKRRRPAPPKEFNLGLREKILIGGKLLGICLEALPDFVVRESYIYVDESSEKLKTREVLVPTPQTLERLDELPRELFRPALLPMVLPPLPWQNSIEGGYRYALADRHPLVKLKPVLPE